MRLGINLGYWGAGQDAEALALAQEAERLDFAVAWAAEAYGSEVKASPNETGSAGTEPGGPFLPPQSLAEPSPASSAHGRAASTWALRLSRVVSSSVRPTSWTPTGRPSAASPHGTTAAGLPATFHSAA